MGCSAPSFYISSQRSRSLNKYHWKEPGELDHHLVSRIVEDFGIPPAGARFLTSRGFVERDAVYRYLNPSPDDAGDPFAFEQMRAAVDLIAKAAREGRSVMVHGDYDVDGISGTAILYRYLDGVFEKVYRFLPDRRKDGYGLATRAVDWAIENNVGLMIAVDCGTSDGALIERLESDGIDVVVCDHHEFPPEDGGRGVVLNPVRPGETYPFQPLCGSGVAFKLVQALYESGVRGRFTPDSQLDLVALATVGDMVPLIGENRYFVHAGLELMNASPRPGLVAIKGYSRLGSNAITSGHISFIFAPRLNAPGRVSRPKPSLEILCTESFDEARRLASELEYDNERRRAFTDVVRDDAFDRIRELPNRNELGGFVLAGDHWDVGVLGIAAARVVEEFGKPTVLLAVEKDTAKGSGRSVPGVNLKKHMDCLTGFFERYGGHSQAVGLTMKASLVEEFGRALSDSLKQDVEPDVTAPPLPVDAPIELEECSLDLVTFLKSCEPFGYGNKEPVWLIRDVQVLRESTYVGENHLKLFFQDERGHRGEAIAFGWDRPETPDDLHNRAVDLAVRIRRGYYMRREYPELRIVDMRSHKSEPREELDSTR